MDANRRNVLKRAFYSGACMLTPLPALIALNKGNDLESPLSLKINPLGDDMYEIDGWVVPLSDLKVA